MPEPASEDGRGSARPLSGHAISEAAAVLADHRRRQAPLDGLPLGLRPGTLAEAYAIQDELVERLTAEHASRPIGYKVACTNAVAQQALQIDRPLFGRLLSHSTTASPARLVAANFTTRVIECEFGLRIEADVPITSLPYSAAEVATFVGEVLPAIEVVDHRFPDWTLGAACIAADNAIHGHWVHGSPDLQDWRQLDLANHVMHARIDGVLMATGSGAAVLGHPLNVLAWLANELPRYGHRLRAGDLVTTGVCTEVFSAEAGADVVADFGSLGPVSLHWS